jgi:hypothetical protein
MPNPALQWFSGFRPCDNCSGSIKTVGIIAHDRRGRPRGTTSICAACLAVALEALTDFGWSNQLTQWEHQREVMRGVHDTDNESAKGRAKRQSREALTRRREEQINE